MAENNQQKTSRTHNHSKINLGVIVFFLIFLYIIANAIYAVIRPNYSFNTVEKGEISDSDTFNALILRDEEVISANRSGYINYFVKDSARSAKNGDVCIIDGSSNGAQASSSEQTDIYSSDAYYSNIREIISGYTKEYSDSAFSDIYTLGYELNNTVNNIVSENNISKIKNYKNNSNYSVLQAEECGIISYTIDGYEDLDMDNISDASFDTSSYTKSQLLAGSYVESGDPVCKLITDDSWDLIIKLNGEQLNKLQNLQSYIDNSEVDIRFLKDDVKTTAEVSVFSSNGATYAALTLSSYMVRYCNERFENIEIVWSDTEGLKIPKTSIVQKDYYKIPAEYLVTENDSNDSGFYVVTDEGPVLTKPDMFVIKEEDPNAVTDENTDETETESSEEDSDVSETESESETETESEFEEESSDDESSDETEDEEAETSSADQEDEVKMITYYYVSCDDFSEGTILQNMDTGEKLTLSKSLNSVSLDCVYNINRGYADLRLATVLCEYGDYCIIKDGDSQSVSVYDHILLNGDSVHEDQIIY